MEVRVSSARKLIDCQKCEHHYVEIRRDGLSSSVMVLWCQLSAYYDTKCPIWDWYIIKEYFE